MKKFTTIKTLLVGLLALGATSAWADDITSLPANYDYTTQDAVDNNSISPFDEGKVIAGTNVKALTINNTTATAWFDNDADTEGRQPYSIAAKEKVTIKLNNYHGWLGNGQAATVTVYAPEGKPIVSYSYTLGSCNISDVKIGGTTVDGFAAFACQSKLNNNKNANGLSGNGSPYQAKDGWNPTITISISGSRYVEIHFEESANNVDKLFSGVLGDDFTMALEKIEVSNPNNNEDRGYHIGKLDISSEAVSEANVTFKFVDENSNSIKADQIVSSKIGDVIDEIIPGGYKDPIISDGNKYLFDSYECNEETVPADGATVTMKFKTALKYSYTVKAVFGETELKTIKEGTDFQDVTVTVPYYKYVTLDGKLYTKDATDKEYNYRFDLKNDSQVEKIAYTEKASSTIVYLSEGEEIEGLTICTSANTGSRSSHSSSAYATEDTKITTLPAGKYRIHVAIYDASSKPDSHWIFKAGETQVADFNCTIINIQEFDSEAFTLEEESDIILAAGGNIYMGLDLIYIESVPEPFTYTVNCVDEDKNLLQDITKTGYEGETLNIAWNKYIKVDGQWYVTEAPYVGAYTEEGTSDVIYKKADIYDFIELESTNYKTAGDTNNNTNASGGTGVLLASGSAMATKDKIAAGTYDFSVYGFVRRSNADELILQISADGSEWTDVTTLTFESGKAQTQTAYRVVLSEDSYVRFLENKGQNTCHYFDYVVITETPAVATVEITAAGYATYCSKYALNLDGIEAYTATIDGSTVKFEQINTVNKVVAPGTGLLIKAAEGTLEIPVAAEGEVIENNALIGVTEDTAIAPGIFVLLNGEKGVGLYKTHRTFTVKANSAYFAALPSEEEAREFIALNGEATAIKAIETEQSNEIYNLAGQRVKSAQKGLYIIGGKKVIK